MAKVYQVHFTADGEGVRAASVKVAADRFDNNEASGFIEFFKCDQSLPPPPDQSPRRGWVTHLYRGC